MKVRILPRELLIYGVAGQWSGRRLVKVEIAGSKSRQHRARVVQRKNAWMTARRGAFGSRRGYSSSHGVTDSTADYGSAGEGSSPSGSAQGWLAQWESTRFTSARRRFDTFAGYGERGVEVCMRGRDPRGPGSIPGVHPKGGLFMGEISGP